MSEAMTADLPPLTDAELEALDNSHCDTGLGTNASCLECGYPYPCPTVSAITELRALREQNAALESRILGYQITLQETGQQLAELHTQNAAREQNAALHKYVTELIDKNVALVAALEYIRDQADQTITWRQTRGMKPATDISMFAATSLSACIKVRREMEQVLARVRGAE